MDWRKYQEKVALLFRELGCEADIEEPVQGARGVHDVDVWVTFDYLGMKNKWVIECKFWNSPVPKEKVLALKSIVEDVGADKGIIITEIGFQSGAYQSSSYTNISLMTFEELNEIVKDDIRVIMINKMEKELSCLLEKIHGFYETKQEGNHMRISTPKKQFSKDPIKLMGILSMLETGIKWVRMERFPVPVSYDEKNNSVISVGDIDTFIKEAGNVITDIKQIVIDEEQKL